MANNLRDLSVNGSAVSACDNTSGKTFYLYEGDIRTEDGVDRHMYTWSSKEPGSQESGLSPCTMPSSFELAETTSGQPVLKKW